LSWSQVILSQWSKVAPEIWFVPTHAINSLGLTRGGDVLRRLLPASCAGAGEECRAAAPVSTGHRLIGMLGVAEPRLEGAPHASRAVVASIAATLVGMIRISR
jgi:hypothetical protein